MAVLAPASRPRRAQDTLLHRIVREHRETFPDHGQESYKKPPPKSVRAPRLGFRVRRDNGLRLMREGTRPILRGTIWKVSDRRAFLWGSGFKPSLRSYDGWEVPKPVQIDVQFGTASIDQVARDIYGLTKLNYNTCKLGESEPVTVGFSDMVGEILVSNPTVTDRRPQFRFYI